MTQQTARRERLPFLGLMLLLLPAAAGCRGPAWGEVSGAITFQGQPLSAGQISFFGEDGRTATALIQQDGTYSLLAPTGLAKVTVDSRPRAPIHVNRVPVHVTGADETPSPGVPPGVSPATSGAEAPKPGGRTPVVYQPQGKHVPIPARYAQLDQTPLRFQVRGGPQTFDVQLEP